MGEAVIGKEALGISASACEILPSALGEHIGDFGSLCAAGTYYESEERKG